MRSSRLVVDANVIVSALLVRSELPLRAYENAVRHGPLVFTDNSRRELIATLLSSKFDKYAVRSRREAYLATLAPVMDVVAVFQLVRVCRDPFDDSVLEAALNGRAEAIVTGDSDLLSLHPFKGIPILKPADYLARIVEGQ